MISMRQCLSALVLIDWPTNLDTFCANPEILGEKCAKSGRERGWAVWGMGGWAVWVGAVLLSMFFRLFGKGCGSL